ncbi:MAG: hypothetical protein JSV45_13930 [Chromatiales bacterium]|nr:MAG: hypothetical protein JSV45_13930 [Chromatiales bacterium]
MGLLTLAVFLPDGWVAAQSVQREDLRLANAWQNYTRNRDFTPVEVFRQGGICKLAGIIDRGYRRHLATLPSWCRPNQRLIFQANTINHRPVRVDVYPGGQITMSQSLWRSMPGVLKQLDVAEDGAIWGVTTADKIFRWDGRKWIEMPGGLRQITVGSTTVIWGIGPDNNVYRWNVRTWEKVPADVSLTMVSAGADGSVWGLGKSGEVYRWSPPRRKLPATWTRIDGAPQLKYLDIGNASNVWGVDLNDGIHRWNGSGWATVNGRLKNLSVAADGTVWGTNASDRIYKRLGDRWQRVDGSARQVAVGKAGVAWQVNSKGRMWRWVGLRWLSLDGLSFAVDRGTPLALASGWQNYSGDTGTYRGAAVTRQDNLCVVSGLIKGTNWADLATLPPECRPDKNLIFSLHANQATPARVDVYPSGRIVFRSGGKRNWISLGGITFSVGSGDALPLASDWRNYGGDWRPARVTRNGDLCELSGLIRGSEWTQLATVPEECRPPKRVMFLQHANDATPARIDVLADGQVRYMSGGRNTWVSLSGMSWKGPSVSTSVEAVALEPAPTTSTSPLPVVGSVAPITAILAAGASTPVADGQAGIGLLGYASGELVTQATLGAGSQIGTWTLPADAQVLTPTGDFNGDGREDLVIWTPTGLALVSPSPPSRAGQLGGWQLLTAVNNGVRAGGWQIGTDRQILHGTGDFNGDGRDDLLLTGPNAIGVLTLGNEGLTTLAMHVNGTRLGGWIIDTPKNRIEGLGDFDGNNTADILITSGWGIGVLTLSGSNLTSIMLKPNGTRFGGWLYDSRGNPIQGIGDFDGNGRDDFLITSGWGIGVLTLDRDTFNSLMLKPNGTRFGGWLYDSKGNPIRGVGDFDGNGRDDFVITSGWGIGVLTLAGDTFNSLMLKPKGTRFGGWLYDPANTIGEVDDFDGNGRADFVISSGWGVGILTLAGDTLNSLTLKPHGTQLNGWTLAKADMLPAAGTLTNPQIAAMAAQRPAVADAPAAAPVIASHELRSSPVPGTVVVLSSDITKATLRPGTTASDAQAVQAITSARNGAEIVVGRLRQVGPDGMAVRNPMLFDDQGVSSLGTKPIRFGNADRFAPMPAGEYFLEPGTYVLDDPHFGSSGLGGGNCGTSCQGFPQQNACEAPDFPDLGGPGGGDIDWQVQQAYSFFPPSDEQNVANVGNTNVDCDGFCPSVAQCVDPPPLPEKPDLPFGQVTCSAAPSSISKVCQQFGGTGAGILDALCTDGRGPISYTPDSGSGLGMLGDPTCSIADYAPGEIPQQCENIPNKDEIIAQLAAGAPGLEAQFKYIGCLMSPGLAICEAARQAAIDICPTGAPQTCADIQDATEQTYKFCGQNSCMVCGPATNYTCVPTGPDPSVQFADGGGAGEAETGGEGSGEGEGEGEPESATAQPKADAETKKDEKPEPPPEEKPKPAPDPKDEEDGTEEVDEVGGTKYKQVAPFEWEEVEDEAKNKKKKNSSGTDSNSGGETPAGDKGKSGDDKGKDDSDRKTNKKDPISLASGELSFVDSDVSFPARGIGFDFVRRYGSSAIRSGALGPGWIHEYEDYIEPVGDRFNRQDAPKYCTEKLPKVQCLYRYSEYGGQTLYVLDRGTGVFAPQPGGFELIRVTERGYKLLEPGGTIRAYNWVGRLEKITDAEGYGLDLTWRVRDWSEVDRDGNPFRYGFGSLLDQVTESFGIAFDGAGQTELNFRQRRSLFARYELARVVDSYGRVFEFEYQSFPETSSNTIRRRRLTSIKYRGEPLVEYRYKWLDVTKEAYLEKVIRRGLSQGLEATGPLVTRYGYQHDIIDTPGELLGAVPASSPFPPLNPFRGRILEVI